MQTRVIERVGSDRVALLNAVVMLTGDPLLLLALRVLSIRRLLDAARRNSLRASDRAGLVPEHIASSVIPLDQAVDFSDLVRPYPSNVVDMANRWLSKYSVRDQPRAANSELVGVRTFVFRD